MIHHNGHQLARTPWDDRKWVCCACGRFGTRNRHGEWLGEVARIECPAVQADREEDEYGLGYMQGRGAS